MRYFRNHIISRIVCLLMAFHIFNVSVDLPDGQPSYVPEDLSVNELESFVELVLEAWLGIDNAVAEHDEPGDESDDLELSKEFKYTPHHLAEITFQDNFTEISGPPYTDAYCPQYTREINPPPPKA